MLSRSLSSSSTESSDVSHSIAISRAINFWEIYSDILNFKNDAMNESLRNGEKNWIDDLLTLIWSHFDHNIDVRFKFKIE